MICNRERLEGLYLSKGDQDIYIDNCKIPQHHIDGIRFLYRQYKKKKSGVIINYRPEYARNLQIVLFLKAIHCLLKKPVLVLCKEGAEHNWMEQFKTWTDFYDEVVLETQKPFIKKLVLINTMSNLQVFARHEWSVVIVDDDETAYQVLKLHFKADYKIYTTSVNMKDNIEIFSQVYKWLYPEEAKEKGKWKFDKKYFIADRDNVRDVIDKAILLDAFMADIVATNDTTDSCSEEFKPIGHETDSSTPIMVSRKNKDATGTKIKRSRRIEFDEDDDIPLSKGKTDSDLSKESSKIKSLKPNSKETSNTTLGSSTPSSDENEDFNIENFKKKRNKKIKEDVMFMEESEAADINMDIVNSKSQPNLFYEPDSVTDNSDRFYEMDTLVFSDHCGDQGSNINEPIIEASNLDKNDENEDIEPDKIANKLNDKNITESNDEMNLKNNEFETIENCNHIDDIKSNGEGSPSIFTEINLNDNDIDMKMNSPCNNEIGSDVEGKTNDQSCQIVKETSNDINSNLNKRETELKQNEFNDGTKTITNKIVTPVVNVLKRNCFEDEMNEIEEKALKKFKGSFLDSLF